MTRGSVLCADMHAPTELPPNAREPVHRVFQTAGEHDEICNPWQACRDLSFVRKLGLRPLLRPLVCGLQTARLFRLRLIVAEIAVYTILV